MVMEIEKNRKMQYSVVHVLMCLCILGVNLSLAGKRGKKGRKCGPWVFEPCIPKNGICGKGFKNGTRMAPSDGSKCHAGTKTKKFRCNFPCAVTNHADARCKYKKRQWTACDLATMSMNNTMILKKGPANCPSTKTIIKKCKKNRGKGINACKYRKTSMWSKCNVKRNVKKMTLTLKKGDITKCPRVKIISKKCKIKGKNKFGKAKKKKDCKYTNSGWSLCDNTSGLQIKELTLVTGDHTKCSANKTFTRKCKNEEIHLIHNFMKLGKQCKKPKPAWRIRKRKRKRLNRHYGCRYLRGVWSECNATSLTKRRTDTLNHNVAATCQPTRIITKSCKLKCRYEPGSWSECTEGKKTRVMTLRAGSSAGCTTEKKIHRKCKVKLGASRCSFGRWGDFGACQNGVQKKTRQVLSGGYRCQRKAVKTKQC